MTSTYDQLDALLRPAFEQLSPGADPVLRVSEHGDYQANGVMGLAKALGRNPREVAQDIVDRLDLTGVATVTVAGPGFLNIALDEAYLGGQVTGLLADERLGVARGSAHTVVIDYSAPNVAKEMHVGHLRSTVIGDALARLHRFVGHHVVARNHVGDWGTPFGMLIEHLVDLGEEDALRTLTIGDLDGFYRQARAKFDEDDAFRERARQRVVALQAGDPETRRLWRLLVDESVAYFSEVYAALDITLTPADVVGESSYNDDLLQVVEDLRRLGLLRESDGAWCAFPAGFVNREGEPLPLIVQKRDEGFGYAATDLAAVRDRVERVGAKEILYVVGSPQAQHFDMVFAVAREAGWLPPDVSAVHVNFGNVLGPDHKMFKSRSGETIKLINLLNEAIDRADAALLAREPEGDPESRRRLAEAIGRGAIKYADLSTDRQRDYVFDLDRMVAFEGDTGPYLQYAHARVCSILRRAGEEIVTPGRFTWDEPAERALALGLLRLSDAVDGALATHQPHKLSGYLFDLSQRLTAFYDACPVLSAEGDLRRQRLVLCELTRRVLAQGLDLLGIAAPSQM